MDSLLFAMNSFLIFYKKIAWSEFGLIYDNKIKIAEGFGAPTRTQTELTKENFLRLFLSGNSPKLYPESLQMCTYVCYPILF